MAEGADPGVFNHPQIVTTPVYPRAPPYKYLYSSGWYGGNSHSPADLGYRFHGVASRPSAATTVGGATVDRSLSLVC
ncbi:MAG: hypothetical protein JWO38_7882 [Gemmataceae bacterium]|nr:hypothetical protein [Gemmataceae bacterium]